MSQGVTSSFVANQVQSDPGANAMFAGADKKPIGARFVLLSLPAPRLISDLESCGRRGARYGAPGYDTRR